MRFITIDLEGDANVQQCKEFFKEGNHFDKDTIPWCISFYNGEDLNTIVCKLPEDTRPIYKDGIVVGRTRSYHSKETKVPNNCILCFMFQLYTKSGNLSRKKFPLPTSTSIPHPVS